MTTGPYRKLIRYQVRPERADLNRQLLAKLVDDLHRTAPADYSFLALQLGEGGFLHVSLVDRPDGVAPLHELEGFQAWSSDLAARTISGPDFEDARFMASYEPWRIAKVFEK